MKFSEKGAGWGGQRPFGNFPEIHQFWGRQASLRFHISAIFVKAFCHSTPCLYQVEQASNRMYSSSTKTREVYIRKSIPDAREISWGLRSLSKRGNLKGWHSSSYESIPRDVSEKPPSTPIKIDSVEINPSLVMIREWRKRVTPLSKITSNPVQIKMLRWVWANESKIPKFFLAYTRD